MLNRSRWQALLGVGAGLLVAGYSVSSLMGCSSSAPTTGHPPASQLQEGLNILDAHDAAVGFGAAYVKAGRVVYIESRVGAQKPEIYRRAWPDEPANEMDMRFVDQGNHTFYAQRGGDSWVDSTWNIQMNKDIDPTLSLADRDLDYTLAQEGAKALIAALPATFKDHAYHLNNFVAMTPPTRDPVLMARIQELNAKAPQPARTRRTVTTPTRRGRSSTRRSTRRASPRGRARTARSRCIRTRTSATGSTSSPPATTAYVPGASNISYNCHRGTRGWFQYGVQNGSTVTGVTGSGDGAGGCQTAYNWDSGGYDHLCNDDAAFELWQAKDGSQWTYLGFENGDAIGFQYYGAGSCAAEFCGSSPAHFACDCQTFGGCSGDWNTPELAR